jgi:hypothetical protein
VENGIQDAVGAKVLKKQQAQAEGLCGMLIKVL